MFKDRFCAVNKIGRTVAFGPGDSVELLTEYVDGGDMKFLVESEGELLLVDIYDPHRYGFPGEYGLKLDVFRLDEKEKKWVKLASLGERIIFLSKEIVSSLVMMHSTMLTRCFVGCVFFTWINAGFPLYLIVPSTSTCFGHLQNGSSTAAFVKR
ncbi:hypothetical protein MtrunA17_Chr8g0351561 [Medicago truncatula]|uniref:Transmembrane protein, putative n=1 Tax=Medicago truncatula TaxID=3880 RepID=A0A072TQB0_MEDTR|nr:transmembrane protein, putative [Medicago truncatula]RHN40142.1 hypothetical protein MtrunA17_Chr8g0351561 [Medicago truncatula]